MGNTTPTPVASIDPTLGTARQYVQYVHEKQRLEASLKLVKEQMDELEPRVLDHMANNGVQRMTVDGITLHIRRELWARATSPEAPDVLRAHDLGFMARETVNAQTLSAWVREQDANGTPIPEAIAAVIAVAEVYKLGAVSA